MSGALRRGLSGLLALALGSGLAPAPAQAGPLRAVLRAADEADDDALVGFLDHKRAYVREQAARALAGRPARPAALPPLRACVGDSTAPGWLRAACAAPLGRWGDAEAVPIIELALAEVDPESRYWLAEALHQMQHPEARAVLQGLRGTDELLLSTALHAWAR